MKVAVALCVSAYPWIPAHVAWANEFALAKPKKPMLSFLLLAAEAPDVGVDELVVAGLLQPATTSASAAAAPTAASRRARVTTAPQEVRGGQKGVDSSPGRTRTVRQRQARPAWCPAVRRAPGTGKLATDRRPTAGNPRPRPSRL